MWEHPGWGRAARAGSLGKPGAPRAGASRLAELVLLLLPVAHLEQGFRGCPGIDARPGCQREAAQLLARAVLPAAARAPCRCPATLLAPSLSLCMKILLGQIWDKPSRQHYMVPTAAFTFPVLSCGPAAWHKVSAAPARGSGDSQGGWWQWQRGGRGAGSAWPPAPDSCQTSAAGGSWLPPGSGGKTTEQEGSREGQPAQHGLPFGVGDPDPAGWSSLGGAPGPLGSPMQPPAWNGMAQHDGEGHWVTRPGCHASSAAEGESIGCLINSSHVPNLHQG